jgi:hypothetical protein
MGRTRALEAVFAACFPFVRVGGVASTDPR